MARNGERRPFLCGVGTVRWFELVPWLSREELRRDAGEGEGDRCRERGMALASSGFLMNTHSYLSISGRTVNTKHSPVPKKPDVAPLFFLSLQSEERNAPHTSPSVVFMSSTVGS